MPYATADDGLRLFYVEECFAPPWTEPPVALLIHGIAENLRCWYAWPPLLGPHARLILYDWRGHGQSDVPPPGALWTPERLVKDALSVLDAVGVPRAHIVAMRAGCAVATALALAAPERVRSLALIGGPVRVPGEEMGFGAWADQIEREGTYPWAKQSMAPRLADEGVPSEMVEWWAQEMGKTSPHVVAPLIRMAAQVDLTGRLGEIIAPTLWVVTEGSKLVPPTQARAAAARLPNGEFVVLPGSAYHVAATRPAQCAELVLRLWQRAG
jgi:pimeloyl-ACP methyl ester carboxylesterase